MEIILEKDGDVVTLKDGNAYYCLWLTFLPFIAWALAIFKKQFKGVVVNIFAFSVILAIITMILGSISPILEAFVQGLGIIAYIYFTVMYTLNANKYSIAAKLESGYTVKNINEPGVREAVAVCRQTSYPIFQITNF